MPTTPFQKKILKLIAANRSPESYVAGATIIHRQPGSPRFSNDIDLFHDPAASVLECASKDLKTLGEAGLQVEVLLQTANFVRALVRAGQDGLKLEWATDTAFRFFPIIADPELGYRLHDIDAAVNKCLALAGRSAIRDLIDVLTIHETTLHLGACSWAACGKDSGFTPDLILEMVARHAVITPDLLAEQQLAVPIDPRAIKQKWLSVLEEARALISKLDPAELGCIYLNEKGEVPIVPGKKCRPHHGSVRGAWPVVAS